MAETQTQPAQQTHKHHNHDKHPQGVIRLVNEAQAFLLRMRIEKLLEEKAGDKLDEIARAAVDIAVDHMDDALENVKIQKRKHKEHVGQTASK